MARIAIGSMKNYNKNERQTVLKNRISLHLPSYSLIDSTVLLAKFAFESNRLPDLQHLSEYRTVCLKNLQILHWTTFNVVRSIDILNCKSKFGKFGWNCVKDTIKCFPFRTHFQNGFRILLKIWEPSNDSIIETHQNTHYTHIYL